MCCCPCRVERLIPEPSPFSSSKQDLGTILVPTFSDVVNKPKKLITCKQVPATPWQPAYSSLDDFTQKVELYAGRQVLHHQLALR